MSTVGHLSIKLGLDHLAFESGIFKADNALSQFAARIQDTFKELEKTLTRIGAGMTAAVTVPLGLLSRSAAKTAADFETAMNRVESALRPLTPQRFDQLRAAALQLGPAVGLSATEAAEAIGELGRAGMSAGDILAGGLQNTLTMAKANMGEVTDSAGLLIDVLGQFNLSAADASRVVNEVTGGLDATKFGFQDYRLAVGQAGSAAAAAGVSFSDFNASLAATAKEFLGGSNAGTAFRTFISRLVPQSDEAEAAMRQLGLITGENNNLFFDAEDRFVGMAAAAELLRSKLGNLSDRSLNEAINTIWGQDAMATAIGLMRTGGDEFEKLAARIAGTKVGEKLSLEMRGLNQAVTDLANAGERLRIALGDAGLLTMFTGLTKAVGAVVGAIGNLPSPFLSVAIHVGTLAAAIGPLILLVTKVIVPIMMLSGKLSTLGIVIAALINPIGALILVVGRLVGGMALARVGITLFGVAVTRLLGPITMAISLLSMLLMGLGSTASAMDAAKEATARSTEAHSAAEAQVLRLANAQGELRNQIVATMRVQLAQARLYAQAADLRVRASEARVRRLVGEEGQYPTSLTGTAAGYAGVARGQAQRRTAAARAELQDRQLAAQERRAAVGVYERGLAEGERPAPRSSPPNLGNAAARSQSGGGADRAREIEERNHRREMLALNQQLAAARAQEDRDGERAIQRTIDLKERTREYRDLEFSAAESAAKAAADFAEIDGNQTVARERNLELTNASVELEEARIYGLQGTISRLEQEREIREATEELQRQGLSLEEATAEATRQRLIVEQARINLRARERREAEAERQIELARLRGDRTRQRELEREAWITRRGREIADSEKRDYDAKTDRAAAAGEWSEGEEARLTGLFRSSFRDGVKAAMGGDLGRWLTDAWTDIWSDALENSLNQVADMLRDLLRNLTGNFGGGEKGGFLGSILGALGGLFGGNGVAAKAMSGLPAVVTGMKPLAGLPGFAGGGSFDVGGRGGIDQNLVSFWATRGEHVNISKGESKSRPARVMIVPTPYFDAHVQGQATAVAAPLAAAAEHGGSLRAQRRMAQRSARRLS